MRTAPAEAVGRAVFGESNHPQLEACFRAAQASFPNLYPDYAPRIERHIRQLVPLKLATIATIGDGALETAGNLVEAVAATTREFNELGAADMMAGMLAQRRKGRHVRTLVRRGDGPCRLPRGDRGAQAVARLLPAPYRGTRREGPPCGRKPRGRARGAERAVSDVVRAPDDAGVERTLFDRRNIVGQAVQQIRMQPAQLRGA